LKNVLSRSTPEYCKWHPGAVAHLAWKKGACRGSATFHITYQHKTTD